MYNIIRHHLLAASAICLALASTANTTENFNSRNGAPLKQVRSELQNRCWTFHQFDINLNGWNPAIEGDGAMVSTAEAIHSGNAGIYTPLLHVTSSLRISFNYRFNKDFDNKEVRWLKLCLTDNTNTIRQVLDEFHINGANAAMVNTYATTFNNVKQGELRLVLFYGGTGGNATIAIDELIVSAPFKFSSGCNLAPTADAIKIMGQPDRTARGKLTTSPSNLKVFLAKPSPDGIVDIKTDGTFVFTPKNDFAGKSTSFSYTLCENVSSNLCSEPVNVKIDFPKPQLASFHGAYKSNGNVQLVWNTSKESTIRNFVVERSTDGKAWHRSPAIAMNDATNNNEFTYIDHVGKNIALKRDLYYRLIHTDESGNINTSKTMVVRVYNTQALTMISVAPNPNKREVAVNVQLPASSMVTLRVFDASNNTILRQTVECLEGFNSIPVSGSRDLSPGNYMLEVIVNSKERMLVKLIKE
jgi:hypothetical protein